MSSGGSLRICEPEDAVVDMVIMDLALLWVRVSGTSKSSLGVDKTTQYSETLVHRGTFRLAGVSSVSVREEIYGSYFKMISFVTKIHI